MARKLLIAFIGIVTVLCLSFVSYLLIPLSDKNQGLRLSFPSSRLPSGPATQKEHPGGGGLPLPNTLAEPNTSLLSAFKKWRYFDHFVIVITVLVTVAIVGAIAGAVYLKVAASHSAITQPPVHQDQKPYQPDTNGSCCASPPWTVIGVAIFITMVAIPGTLKIRNKIQRGSFKRSLTSDLKELIDWAPSAKLSPNFDTGAVKKTVKSNVNFPRGEIELQVPCIAGECYGNINMRLFRDNTIQDKDWIALPKEGENWDMRPDDKNPGELVLINISDISRTELRLHKLQILRLIDYLKTVRLAVTKNDTEVDVDMLGPGANAGPGNARAAPVPIPATIVI